jgi:cytochrome P450
MPVSERIFFRLPPGIRRPVGDALVRLPWPGAKLLGFVASPAARGEPWALYRRLRDEHPVYRTPFGATVVSRHEDATMLLRSRAVSVDESRATQVAFERRDDAYVRLLGSSLLDIDPPDHERLRRLVNKAFTPGRVRLLEGEVQRFVRRRLDQLEPAGGMDVLGELSYPLPVAVISELIGVPPSDHQLLINWARDLAARLDIQPARSPAIEAAGDTAAQALSDYLETLLDDPSRRIPGRLIDGLLEAEDSGDHLTRQEVIATCGLILIAGFETTANLVANGILALLDHPEQLDRLRSGEVEPPTAVEELLRHDGPVQLTRRVLLEDVELDGGHIAAGELAIILLAAANRDPDMFAEPDTLNLGRDPNPHLAFSTGIHTCLGARLARMEAAAMISQLIERFPTLRLAARPAWKDTFVLRGLRSLPVTW